jgi:hypothetical protein
MFVPVFLWGVFMGSAFQLLLNLIRHRDLAIPLVTVVFWLSLFLFEKSWIKWMGLTGTLLIYLGGAVVLLDWWLIQRYVHESARESPSASGPTEGRESIA